MITNLTPLTTIQTYPGLHVRTAMIANALSIRYVRAGDRGTRPILDELVGPPVGGWGLDLPYGRGGISTCSTVALGLLRRLNVDDDQVMAPYRPGDGMRQAHRFAHRVGAFAYSYPGNFPLPGDVVDLAPWPGREDKSNHTLTVIETHDDRIVSVDGGQVGTDGLQAIRVVARTWTMVGDRAYLDGRPVYGWIDIDRVPVRETITVPEGWEEITLEGRVT